MFKKLQTKQNAHTNRKKEKEKLKSTQKNIRITRWRHKMKNNLVHKNKKRKKKYNSTFTHSYTPIQSFNPHVINVMTNGGVKQLYIVQFIFVTMILPSQVLFPFINIRRRALQIRKCSEISESIYPYIYTIYVYTYTRSQRYKHLCKRNVIQCNTQTETI